METRTRVPVGDRGRSALRRLARGIREAVPEGLALPEAAWRARHRAIVRLLFLHAIGLAIFAAIRGFGLPHGILEATPVAGAALVASLRRLSRNARSIAAVFGLVTASAILVHLSGGTIEAHFHFFVMLGVISLYQSWQPFLFALGYVVLHHGIMGALDAPSVYNHAAAWANPWKWAAIHGVFVLAASGAQLIAWDFSERARRHSELMLESVGLGMIGLDASGTITFMNRGAADLLGVDRGAVVGRSAVDVLAPTRDDGTPYGPERWPVAGTIDDGETRRIDDVWLRTGGDRIPAEVVTTPIVERGRVIGAMISFRDLTQYLDAMDGLKNAMSLVSSALESTADGLLVVDAAGRITHLNRKFAQMWRIPDAVLASGDDDAALGFVLDQLKDPDGFLAKVRELYATPEATSEDILEFKDGRIFERYSQPQKVDGRSVGRVWSFRDVTERRRLDEMKNGFLTAVSHEMRTPLTSVVGFASTLRRHRDRLSAADKDDVLDRLSENARKLQRLLGDILDLDRLERGILEPRRQPTDMARLVHQIVEEVAAGERRTVIDVAVPPVMVDAPKVERIVENLVTNAMRHTPDDATIWVRAWPERDGIVLAVEDDGPGVPDELKPLIFEPFQQGPSLRKHAPGIGVGLSLIARFAELHGGTASVHERDGGGASFRIYLPAPPAEMRAGRLRPVQDRSAPVPGVVAEA